MKPTENMTELLPKYKGIPQNGIVMQSSVPFFVKNRGTGRKKAWMHENSSGNTRQFVVTILSFHKHSFIPELFTGIQQQEKSQHKEFPSSFFLSSNFGHTYYRPFSFLTFFCILLLIMQQNRRKGPLYIGGMEKWNGGGGIRRYRVRHSFFISRVFSPKSLPAKHWLKWKIGRTFPYKNQRSEASAYLHPCMLRYDQFRSAARTSLADKGLKP